MWTAVAIVAVLVLYFIAVYNGLVARKNQAREAFATIDTQLKRRYDLIPNLVETVRGAAKHERETLDAVIAARNSAMNATGDARAAAENQLSGAHCRKITRHCARMKTFWNYSVNCPIQKTKFRHRASSITPWSWR